VLPLVSRIIAGHVDISGIPTGLASAISATDTARAVMPVSNASPMTHGK
jgi:hypothetical protein